MLQTMRSAAKYIWIVLIIAFVGGFLLVDSSGLLGRSPVTTNTVIAQVNGDDILYVRWEAAVQGLEEQETQRLGRGITLDERRQLEDRAFEELVNEVLLRQEYERRGISVTDDEIRDAASVSPPPGVESNPEFQTDGQFDITKYQRFLASPVARQAGMLSQLESFYRAEIPKQKLFDQIASDVWVSDARLWQLYKDRNDTARVSYVAFRPENAQGSVEVTDAEISDFYNKNRDSFERPARAVVALVAVERAVTAADSIAARRRIDSIRAELVAGADFSTVAERESADSASGINGGELGSGVRGRFVEPFENAAYALSVGELSQPVQTQFGWHLIKVDSRQGDTLDLRHILINVGQSDSTQAATDRTADRLFAIAGSATEPALFDSAAAELGLPVSSVVVLEDEPLNFAGRYVPSVSAWAFSGVQVGESSDLYDSPDAYYIARLDSVRAGGVAPLDGEIKDEIRRRIEREKRVDALVPLATRVAEQARRTTLEAAAADLGDQIQQSIPFARATLVPGIGQFNKAVGAAFGLAVGEVSNAIRTTDDVFVLRLDAFTPADSAAFVTSLPGFRAQTTQALRSERVQQYLIGLREDAKIKDDRQKIRANLRRQAPV